MASSKYKVYLGSRFIGHYPGNSPKAAMKNAALRSLEGFPEDTVLSAFKVKGLEGNEAVSASIKECLEY